MNTSQGTNRLFPIFVKLESLHVLLVGGGEVALEKLTALLTNSPATAVCIVSIDFCQELLHFAASSQNVTLIQRKFEKEDLDDVDLVITAINDVAVSVEIARYANQRRILINAADKPELCDFYLGSIVQKGHLKIAISTNGKSPTMAKRLKHFIYQIIPDEIDGALDALYAVRKQLHGDLKAKVKILDEITKTFVYNESNKR